MINLRVMLAISKHVNFKCVAKKSKGMVSLTDALFGRRKNDCSFLKENAKTTNNKRTFFENMCFLPVSPFLLGLRQVKEKERAMLRSKHRSNLS